jgi:hypothetical protein
MPVPLSTSSAPSSPSDPVFPTQCNLSCTKSIEACRSASRTRNRRTMIAPTCLATSTCCLRCFHLLCLPISALYIPHSPTRYSTISNKLPLECKAPSFVSLTSYTNQHRAAMDALSTPQSHSLPIGSTGYGSTTFLFTKVPCL